MKLLFSLLIFQFVFFAVPSVHAAETAATEQEVDYYQCSMHPWIVSDKPGNCPICGMKLTKAQPGSVHSQINNGRAVIAISPERQQLIGISKEKAQTRPLIYSIHSVGHVAYNPDVATALAEYREAYAAYRKSRTNPTETIRERVMQVMTLADLKLRLAGMSSEQFEQVKNASFDTQILNNFFSPEGLILPDGFVWVDTDLYESDSELVKPGQEVLMTASALPGKSFKGAVRVVDPLLNEFPRKLRVRIETEHGGVLKEGMAIDIRIKVDAGEKLAVPETALLESGHSQIVFVDHGEGSIEPREVQAGQLADGYYEIVAGLHENETVITSATFLIDSESRLRAAAQGFSKNNSTEAVPAGGHQH